MLKLYINNKRASVIFSSIQRMYMFVSLCLTPLHSPNVLVKAPAAVNSMCHKKDKKDRKIQSEGVGLDQPHNIDKIALYIYMENIYLKV